MYSGKMSSLPFLAAFWCSARFCPAPLCHYDSGDRVVYVWPDHQDSKLSARHSTHLRFFFSGQSSDAFQAEKDRHGRITEECGIRIGIVDNFPEKFLKRG